MNTPSNPPRHVAIIMDGNGRWANAQGKKRVMGHKKGMEVARQTLESCGNAGVEILTLFAFSSENWRRPEDEVSYLMSLFVEGLSKESHKLKENGIRLKVIGDHTMFKPKLQKAIEKAEALTEGCDRGLLNIAANYGGRADILRASQRLAERVAAGEMTADDINEQSFADETYLAGLPDPDLMIRTGGEQRISNFLLWQMAYTEFYFTETLWPDFDETELFKAFDAFTSRQRRFGRTGQQVAEQGTEG